MAPLAGHWPYPRWIAHRGAGKLAPENTLAAFEAGRAHGFRMYECDVKLSRDGVPFLLHDATLERTTNGLGLAGDRVWSDLACLDAGGWLSAVFKNEPLLTLQALCEWLGQQRHLVNLEIKPTPGQEEETGRVVAQSVRRWWDTQLPWPLLSSFEPQALLAAKMADAELPRALLLDQWRDSWLDEASELACVAVVPRHGLLNEACISQAHAVGLRVLTYTVNDAARADELWAMGLDGLITDQVDLFEHQARADAMSTK